MFPHESSKKNYGSASDPNWYNRRDDTFRQTYRGKYCDDRHSNSDVSHIIASGNGGINATQNVYMFDSKMNRSIQDSQSGQSINAALVGKDRAIEAARVSRRLGAYDGPTGSSLYNQGERYLEKKGILVKQGGGIDRRSEAVRNGSLSLNKDGSIRANAGYQFWK
jgi:hypothetical protein